MAVLLVGMVLLMSGIAMIAIHFVPDHLKEQSFILSMGKVISSEQYHESDFIYCKSL
jgi:uncharacterized membrane protein HdeD (DUF308 family)